MLQRTKEKGNRQQSIIFIQAVIKKEIIEWDSNPRPLTLYESFFIPSFIFSLERKKKRSRFKLPRTLSSIQKLICLVDYNICGLVRLALILLHIIILQ